MGRAHKLSALQVQKLTTPGMYGDGAGLWLKVTPGGTKSWILRYTFGGRERWAGLGPLVDVSIAEARDAASAFRKKVRGGIDPLDEKRERLNTVRASHTKSVTFDWCAEQYIDAHKAGWKNRKHVDQWRNTLATYAGPVIGDLPVASVDMPLVLRILEPIWTTKNETASRLRGRIESVLDWATVRGFRAGDNPARWKGHLDKVLPAPGKVQKVEHHAALPYQQAGAFMAELRKREGMAARALEFAILAACRSGEVRGATWQEIDLAARIWVIPGERMKAGKEHRVPLSDAAVSLLEALPRLEGSDAVFFAPRGGALTDMALTAVLRRMGRGDLTAHGFRSTFRDWAGETTAFPREVIEHALAHQLKDKAEAAYQRGDLLAKRERLMQSWSEHCSTTQQTKAAIPLRRNTAA